MKKLKNCFQKFQTLSTNEEVKTLKRWIRRFEYLMILITLTYSFSILLQSIETKDSSKFIEILNIATAIITGIKNDFNTFLFFSIFLVLMLMILTNPLRGIVFSVFLILIIFIVPNEFFVIVFQKIQIYIETILYCFYVNPELVFVLLLLCFVCVIKYETFRRRFIKIIVNTTEFLFVSVSFYYASFYVNMWDLFLDYLDSFTNNFIYVENFFMIAGITYLLIVFAFKYTSIVKAIVFNVNYRKNHKEDRKVKPTLLQDKDLPMIGICIPAYNEELTILKTVQSILASNYPADKLEIIIVSDGSTDNTVSELIDVYQLNRDDSCLNELYSFVKHEKVNNIFYSTYNKNFYVIDKVNGGKYDSLNTALEYFTPDVKYMTVIDADTILDKDALRILASEAITNRNVTALTGIILPWMSSTKETLKKQLLTIWQMFDYLCSFHISRAGLCLHNNMMIVSGAFGVFNRESIFKVGGYKKTLGEDIFLTLELQQSKNSKILYVPHAVAYTQVPNSLDAVRKQRVRWFKGLTESLIRFRKIWRLNPKMIRPYLEFFILEWLTPLVAPFGIILILGKSDILKNPITLSLFIFTICSNLIESIIAFIIERTYRNISLNYLLYLWLQILMAPLMIIYRNDALLEYYKKNWDKVKRY